MENNYSNIEWKFNELCQIYNSWKLFFVSNINKLSILRIMFLIFLLIDVIRVCKTLCDTYHLIYQNIFINYNFFSERVTSVTTTSSKTFDIQNQEYFRRCDWKSIHIKTEEKCRVTQTRFISHTTSTINKISIENHKIE